jgi:DNA (cytosine-5)-methyltransferase 1
VADDSNHADCQAQIPKTVVIPLIDLFAGPGGLSEGFEGFVTEDGDRPFGCALSIEKETSAHQTLLLRTFFRQFSDAPEEYYEYLRGKISKKVLFERYPAQYKASQQIATRLTLAPWNRKRIDDLVRNAIKANDSWVLIGGPPCQAYSLVGRARRTKESRSEFESDGRHFLYKEYLRVVKKFQPAVFVMENVKGLLSSSAKGVDIFDLMLQDFAGAGYTLHSFNRPENGDHLEPDEYVIEAERHDVPQTRHRVILLGVRKGLDRGTSCLRRQRHQVSIHSAIGDLPRIRSRISPPSLDSDHRWLVELRRLRSVFNREGRLRGFKGRSGGIGPLDGGSEFIQAHITKPRNRSWLARHEQWILDDRIGGIHSHDARRHMPADLRRYLFAAHYARTHRVSPRVAQFPSWLRPAHENLKGSVRKAVFPDRFRVQLKHRPSSTVVSHICKDGHYYIHYDATQCRSLTVREAARLQTFPDNYCFEGTRTQQYHQIGNAVPPLLARQMAAIVYEISRGLVKKAIKNAEAPVQLPGYALSQSTELCDLPMP